MNNKYDKCVIGNTDKTKFFGMNDSYEWLSVTDLDDPSLLILPRWEAELVFSSNRTDYFFVENNFDEIYAIGYRIK